MEYEPEGYLSNYPKYISLDCTEKIMDQMKSKVCKLKLNNGNKGSGFFCKIPFQNKMIPVLITNNHIIDEKELNNENQKIYFSTYNNKELNQKNPEYIELKNRMKYTSVEYDITIIEVKESDNIKDFLDLELEKNNVHYNKETIYILHYPNDENISVSYGIINNIREDKKYEFIHFCNTEKSSSGSPILDLSNNKIIGIHKGTKNNHNLGSFINYPILEFINLNLKKNSITNIDIRNTKETKEEFGTLPFNGLRGDGGILFSTKINAIRRIREELKKLTKDSLTCYSCFTVGFSDEDNPFEWKGSIIGPEDTSYKGGLFYFKIIFPDNYPNSRPEIDFLTPIYHLNVKFFVDSSFPLGHINLNTIDCWQSSFSMREIILEIFYLLSNNNPESPYDYEDGRRRNEFLCNRSLFEEKARYFTKKYANPLEKRKVYTTDWDFTYNK